MADGRKCLEVGELANGVCVYRRSAVADFSCDRIGMERRLSWTSLGLNARDRGRGGRHGLL